MLSLQDYVVIVTGGGNGIGKSIAISYAKEGAKVVIADIDEQNAEDTVKTIRSNQGEGIFFKTDIREYSQIKNLMEQTLNQYGKINILINNAGVSSFKSIHDITVDEWDDVININLRGTFLCSKEAAKHIKLNKKSGSIVNIASTRAFMSEKESEAYAATKGGIIALTHALAISLGNDFINVNAISPGWIETGNYDALRKVDHEQHPAQRVGKPDDIARACLFLTDPKNDFITGENIIIDGGMTRKMIYEH